MCSRPGLWRAGVIGAWLVLLAWTWHARGLLADNEALKYTGCAEQVLAGDLRDLFGNYLKYAAYVLFLLPSVALGWPWLAVVAQALLSLAAARAADRIVRRITGQAWPGGLAFAVFLLLPLLQQWVLALYTESFFISMYLLFLERITRPAPGRGLTALWAVVVLFARPVGMMFVGPAVVWRLASGRQRPRLLLAAGSAAVLIFAVSVPGIRQAQLQPIVEGDVICGFPERPGNMEGLQGSSILAAQVHLFRTQGAGYSTSLFFRRIGAMLMPARAYFSPLHNSINLPILLLYPFALYALWRGRKLPIVGLLAAVLALNIALVGLTHAEWNQRFLAVCLPPVILLAAMGAYLLRIPRQRQGDPTFGGPK